MVGIQAKENLFMVEQEVFDHTRRLVRIIDAACLKTNEQYDLHIHVHPFGQFQGEIPRLGHAYHRLRPAKEHTIQTPPAFHATKERVIISL